MANINVFAFPWKKSDVILVVKEVEFHVHRSILSIQSAVFERMLNGSFKEASQDKITLEGKTSDDMLEFLKLLYPPIMIKVPLMSLTFENCVKMLAIADEYQAEDVISHCLKETRNKIESGNVFEILPYAEKYDQSLRDKCIKVIERDVPTDTLKDKIDDGTLTMDVLVAKCRLLESIVNSEGGDAMLTGLIEGKLPRGKTIMPGCLHAKTATSFREARNCQDCLQGYKKDLERRPKFGFGKVDQLLMDMYLNY